MSAQIFYGKPYADGMVKILQEKFACLNAQIATVGFNDEKWQQYCVSLQNTAAKLNVKCRNIILTDVISAEKMRCTLAELSRDSAVNGIIAEQPLPHEYAGVLTAISPDKDLDCLNPLSISAMYNGQDGLRPATPLAVINLLQFYGINVDGKHVVIVGRGNAVGKPLALMLLHNNATVTVCHTHTVGLPQICRCADILVSACGTPELITADFVTENSIVVDVGLGFVNGKMCGDVCADVYDICQAITPVPGGIGPVTRITLFKNLLQALNI